MRSTARIYRKRGATFARRTELDPADETAAKYRKLVEREVSRQSGKVYG
jgi:hypothetical protein